MSKKYVYLFSEGNANMRELLGGKGANLAEMTNIGMPVPQGFTISTEACTRYYEDGEKIAPEIEAEIFEYLAKMEALVGKKFGDKENPLLVSVRSGARASMPGMMDTILNLGINDEVAATLAAKSGNVRWAYDSYRRFIMMFSDVAMGYDRLKFEAIMDELKAKRGVDNDAGLTAEDMQEMVKRFKVLYKELAGVEFPTDPKVQLMAAVRAVFGSWMNERAIAYRRMNDIPSSWGTAVNVQMMVFGNMGNDCGTGVAFSRDPATGENKLYGEFLMNAQGEDVVAGIRTPQTIRSAPRDQRRGLRPVRRRRQEPREALQGYAGHGVHHRAGQALHAPDPQRQAHRAGRLQGRRRHGQRGPVHQGRGHCQESTPTPSMPCCIRALTIRP